MANTKFKRVLIWLLSECKHFLIIFFAYYDSPLPIGSDELIERLQMWLNNPQCGHKEGHKLTILGWDNHQGESSNKQKKTLITKLLFMLPPLCEFPTTPCSRWYFTCKDTFPMSIAARDINKGYSKLHHYNFHKLSLYATGRSMCQEQEM